MSMIVLVMCINLIKSNMATTNPYRSLIGTPNTMSRVMATIAVSSSITDLMIITGTIMKLTDIKRATEEEVGVITVTLTPTLIAMMNVTVVGTSNSNIIVTCAQPSSSPVSVSALKTSSPHATKAVLEVAEVEDVAVVRNSLENFTRRDHQPMM